MYGEELTEKVIADFESLTLSLEMFMKVKPVMEKWITSVRPHDLVAPCPDWSLPIEIARDRRKRKRTYSEEEERERRRLRKRTKIDPHSRRVLESSFVANSRPSTSELATLAEETKLERQVPLRSLSYIRLIFTEMWSVCGLLTGDRNKRSSPSHRSLIPHQKITTWTLPSLKTLKTLQATTMSCLG